MDTQAIFGLDVLLSFVSSILIAKLFVWPWLRTMEQNHALIRLVVPHMFLRFVGLSFLVPGVVSSELPAAFAIPAGYGDLIAGILATIAMVGLVRCATWALPAVWLFNIWGAADLIFAFVQGARVQLDPGTLGAAFFIVTAIVPPLLVTHALIFGILLKRDHRTIQRLPKL